MSIHEQLTAQFPIRRSKEEKTRFRQWVTGEMERLGWDVVTETTSRGKHENMVIGDPEHAAVVFTAHYDTPADMLVPNMLFPRNIVVSILYQAAFIIVLLAVSLLLGEGVGRLTGSAKASLGAFLAIYFGLLVFLSFGRANKHNANDNTSGVAAVLELAAKIPEEQREKCAFILFDDEERGKQGSKCYAKDHMQTQFMRLIVNMDCVGDGDHILVISKDMARKCTGFGKLEKCLQPRDGLTPHFYDSKLSAMSSDQVNFKCGVAVVACRKKPIVGYVTGRIHTVRDTVCSEANICYLTDSFAAMIDALSHGV